MHIVWELASCEPMARNANPAMASRRLRRIPWFMIILASWVGCIPDASYLRVSRLDDTASPFSRMKCGCIWKPLPKPGCGKSCSGWKKHSRPAPLPAAAEQSSLLALSFFTFPLRGSTMVTCAPCKDS